jgi:hypothetical protein
MRYDLPRAAAGPLNATVAAACFLYALTAAVAAPPNDARVFSIVPQPTAGKTLRYYTVNGLTLTYRAKDDSGKEASFTSRVALSITLRYKVLDVAPDGKARISVVSEGGKARTDTSDETLAPEKDDYPRVVQVDHYNRILGINDEGAASQGKDSGSGQGAVGDIFSQTNLLIQTHLLPMPDHPVKIGDSWTAHYPLPATQKLRKGGDDVVATMTLVGVEMLGTQETLKVKQVFTIPADVDIDARGDAVTGEHTAAGHVGVRMTYTIEANISPADGKLIISAGGVKGTVKFSGAYAKQMPSDSLEIGGSITVSELPEGVATTGTGNVGATH